MGKAIKWDKLKLKVYRRIRNHNRIFYHRKITYTWKWMEHDFYKGKMQIVHWKQKIRQPIINYKRKGFKLQDESEVKGV